ncbi:hypothetical protein RN96_10535 [Fusobacterium polymorphum]|uniref:Uncharacterized protein n=1 Tax=Fusobacterium nucleatum subsp. polymorphum TaxID=76857 RepID=A0A2B7Y954_FUSNP|nr:hypothetical protein [Fusobacterium polymorphum]PGH20604.1 hypothetical protein RN96_10535 [Fusobacterium polymorphum]
MKEYPAITFEIVHQREDGELERIVLSRTQMTEENGKYLVKIDMTQDELKEMQEALKVKKEFIIAYFGSKISDKEVKKRVYG